MTQGRVITSIFFGGGTPSLMQPQTVEKIIVAIYQHWHVSEECEITLEANPTSIELDKFKDFKQAGINRVSVGIQSLNNTDLKFLGRQHSAQDAINALKITSDIFERYSFDLIYARPKQTEEDWHKELKTALDYAPTHLSLYQLTIEKQTPFYTQEKQGLFHMPNNDFAGKLYEVTQDITTNAGLPAYEVSNHAAPEEESRHNLTYWRYDDYVGIGPGAHGRLTINGDKFATREHRAPDIWLKQVKENKHGAHPFESITPAARCNEAIMMGLRISDGISFQKIEDESGKDWQKTLSPEKIKKLVEGGFLIQSKTGLKATPAGWQRLNALLGYLI